MGFTYDIQAAKKDVASGRCLFLCHMLGAVISVFVSTFFVAHIYSLSVNTFDYLKNVAIYYFVVYLTFLLTNYFMCYIVDKTNRVWVFRFSLLLRLAVVLVMIFFGQNLATLLPLAGFMFGFAEGTYYASYNVMKQEMVSRKTMGTFATYGMIVTKVMEIVTPIALGSLMSISSFKESAIFVAIVSAVILIISFFIKSKKPEASNFNLWAYFKKLKEDNIANKKIKNLYVAGIFYGLASTMFPLVNACIMIEVNSTMSLGGIKSLISVGTLVEIFLINKLTKPGKRSFIYAIAIIMPLVGSLIYTVMPSSATIIACNALLAISCVIFQTEYDIYRNGNLKEAGLYSEIAEHQMATEAIFAIGRIIGFVSLFIVSLTKSLIAFHIVFVLLSLSYSAVLYMLARYERKFLNEKVA